MKTRVNRWILLVLVGLLLVGGLAAPQPAFAEEDVVTGVVTAEGQTDGADLQRSSRETVKVPPLPLGKASMDLPRLRGQVTDQIRGDVGRGIFGPVRTPPGLSIDTVNAARENGEKWIEVDLSEQKTYAYEGDRLVKEFIVSTGLPGTPTVQGVFRLWVRVRVQTMSGGNRASGTYYSLPNVEWVQYFYEDYSFHGTYWHNNFGQPMSHGCVNMRNEDAEWLFKWAMPEWDGERDWLRTNEDNATLVYVHE